MQLYPPYKGRHMTIVCLPKHVLARRLMTLLALLLFLQIRLLGLSQQRITLSDSNASLEDVFRSIRKQSGYNFLYNDRLLASAGPVTIRVKGALLEDVLQQCMKDMPLTYKIIDKTVLIKEKVQGSPEPKSSPPTVVTGRVTDSLGNPLPQASVRIRATRMGTVTDNDGRFTITVSSGRDVLEFSHLGYVTQERMVGQNTSLSIRLLSLISSLNDVIVVGYGQGQSRAKITGSVSTLKGEDITTTKNENVVNMLAGKIPGVRISQNSAEPGSFDDQFDIRGLGAPLVIVDGVPRDNYARLDPNDIDNITVLKDASAAVYGVRAANGVVLITTKTGKAGHIEMTYDGNVGEQYLSDWPKLLNIYQWITLINEEAVHNPDGGTRPYTQATVQAYENGTLIPGNWGTAVLNNHALQQQHSLTITGGNDRTTYFVSMGYLYQGGFWKTGDLNYDKYNVRSNITTKVSKGLTFSLRLSGISDEKNQPGVDATWDIFRSLWRNPPNLPLYANNDPGHLYALGDNGYNTLAVTNSDISGYTIAKNKWFQGSVDATYDVPFIHGLQAKALFSYDYHLTDNKQYSKEFNLYTYADSMYTAEPTNAPSAVTRSYYSQPSTLLQYSLEYNRHFSGHNIDVLALYEEQDQQSDNISAYRTLALSSLPQIASGSSAGQIASQDPGGLYENVNKGIVGKLHYDYKLKYLFELSGRYDGSSQFPPNSQWGLFPAVSGGWRISEEKFFKDQKALSFINNVKFRGSYGILGDDAGAAYQFVQGYDYPAGGNGQNGIASGYVFDNSFVTALGFRNLPNADITWYKSKTMNLGTDIDMWGNLLGLEFDWFQRDRSGLLATPQVALPATLGAGISQENLNSDQTRGLELLVTHRNKIGKLTYTVSANISYTRTKNIFVEQAPAGNSYDNWLNNQNNRYNDIWWGYGAAGRFTNYSQIYGYNVDQGGGNRSTLPGDYVYQDWNGDGVIDAGDVHPIGNTYNGSTSGQTPTPNPGAINYGFTLGAEYRQFDFNMVWQGVEDRYVAYSDALLTPLTNNGNGLEQFYNRWHPEDPNADPYNPNTVWVPGTYAYTGTTPLANSLFNIHNSSYLRLKAVTLGYSLPPMLVRKIGVQKVRFYFNGYNILTFTCLKFIDPEHPSSNYGYNYPINKTYNLGLNVTF